MLITRQAKAVLTLGLGLFAFLVTFNNITDYGSNFAFVQHVLSMDTTFPGNALMYRSITTPALSHTGYWIIIFGEGLCCVLLLIGAAALWRARRAPSVEFENAKKWAIAGATVGFLVWFFGFMVIGAEWFAMWQSKTWNGEHQPNRTSDRVGGGLTPAALPHHRTCGSAYGGS